jgi:uncharacterized membrane protein
MPWFTILRTTVVSTFKLYLTVLLTFAVLDAVWIGLLMKGFYNHEFGELARRHDGAMSPRWPAAILVYLLIPLGIVLFVRPAMGASATLLQAAGWGAAYGFIGYGLYDLTNRATLEKWSLTLTAVDMAWGSVICAVSAAAMAMVQGRTTTAL